MILKKIKILRKKFKQYDIDGYIIPKNDEYFSEYAKNDRLKNITGFSGSAGFAVVLKKQNYLFIYVKYDYCLFIYVSIYKALRNPIAIKPQSIKYMYLVYKLYALYLLAQL